MVPAFRGSPSSVTTPSTGNRSKPSEGPPHPARASSARAANPARPRARWRGGSILITGDHLAAAHGAQGLPRGQADAVLEEVDRAVAEEPVHAPRVAAPGPHVEHEGLRRVGVV